MRPTAPWARAAVAGGLTTVVAVALLALVPSPWLWTLWALSLVLLAPTSGRLDRRVAVNLALVAGLLPAALWLPPVLGSRTAALAAIALATGATAAVVVGRTERATPTAAGRDAAIGLAGVLAAVVALPLRSPGTPERALAMLSTGIDNSYHYAMFLEQRLTAAGSPLVASAADGSGFAFDDYPQWFHKLLTVLAQVGFGDPGSAGTELVRFARLQWVVFVALAVLVTAAFLQSLPDRVPPSLLVPSLVILLSLVLAVPGAVNLLQGHLSFLLAASAPLVMFLLVAGPRRPGPGTFVVLGGLVLVTASWLLLLPMAGAVLLPSTVSLWRRQGPVVRWGVLGGATLAGGAAFVLFVLGPLTTGGLVAVLRDGTVPRVGLPTMVPLLVGAVVLVAGLALRRRDLRLGAHLVLTAAAAAQTLVLGGYMLAAAGELTYYFWKLGLGSLLVSVVVAVHAVVLARTTSPEGPRPGRVSPLLATVVSLAAAAGLGSVLQTFTASSALWAAALPGSLEARTTSGDAGDVDLVLRLAGSLDASDAARTRLLATRSEDMNAAHASEWFHALSHSSTRRAVSVDDGVYGLAKDRTDIALGVQLAQGTLEQEDGRVLVTDPALFDAVVAAVGPEAATRVRLTP